MDEIFRESLYNRLRDWILQAGEMIREKIDAPLAVDTKSTPKDLVTEMDWEVEVFFAKKIKQFYPGHEMLGEEGYGDRLTDTAGVLWIIDPIDGTMNFVNQKKNFAISVGIYEDGTGEIGMVYDVMNNQLYSASRGNGAYRNNQRLEQLDTQKKLHSSIICLNHHWLIPNKLIDEKYLHKLIKDVRGTRSYGSAALEFMHVAEGSSDAYISMGLAPWDFAAGRIILHEVGGLMSDIVGQPVSALESSSVLASNPSIQGALLDHYLLLAKK